MAKEEILFEKFIQSVHLNYQDFISTLHEYLIASDCKANIGQKSSGYFISYTFGKTKKSVVNFLFRKKGMIVRIYGENVSKYIDFIDTLPNEMVEYIEKAPVCKRLINPNDCNSKCNMGYDFMIKNENHKKCKNNCFMFDVKNENNPFIKSFIENEIRQRRVA